MIILKLTYQRSILFTLRTSVKVSFIQFDFNFQLILLTHLYLVPVFDGRGRLFSRKKLHKLGNLPLLKEKIKPGSAVLYAYSCIYVLNAKSDMTTLTFGLQWMVLLDMAKGTREC